MHAAQERLIAMVAVHQGVREQIKCRLLRARSIVPELPLGEPFRRCLAEQGHLEPQVGDPVESRGHIDETKPGRRPQSLEQAAPRTTGMQETHPHGITRRLGQLHGQRPEHAGIRTSAQTARPFKPEWALHGFDVNPPFGFCPDSVPFSGPACKPPPSTTTEGNRGPLQKLRSGLSWRSW